MMLVRVPIARCVASARPPRVFQSNKSIRVSCSLSPPLTRTTTEYHGLLPSRCSPSFSRTMGSLLARRISSHLFSHSPFHIHRVPLLTPLLQHQLLSTLPSPSSQPQKEKEMPFIAQYLISSFGFSPDRALKCSAGGHLKAIKSCERPEAVIKFLRDTGLSDSQIKAVVSLQPKLLYYSVDRYLKPNMCDLVENGFSGELLVQLIQYCPLMLLTKKALPRLLFWRDFVAKDDKVLLKIIRRNNTLITSDTDKIIVPKINLFKGYGLSNQDIVFLLGNGTRSVWWSLDSLTQTIELIEELGITRGSRMFLVALNTVGSLSIDEIHKRAEFYKTTYGWSKEDICYAFRRFPVVLAYSEDKIRSNMSFLIEEAKFTPRSIAHSPRLLGYSLEKRLVPRHHVLSILAAKGLKISCTLSTVCGYTEKRFLQKCIEPYEKDMPELAEAYFAAGGGNISV